MELTAREKELYEALKRSISPFLRLPLSVKDAAAAVGSNENELSAALSAMCSAGLIDEEIACRVEVQNLVDKHFTRFRNLVSAPLLTADEIRAGVVVPERDPERPMMTVALPREFAGSRVRYCSFLVEDDVMTARGIRRGDVVVCGINLPARRESPVLCIMPDSGKVCVRTYFFSHTMWSELSDPAREDVTFFFETPEKRVVLGPIVSVQRFCLWYRPAMPKGKAVKK